jgi:hypothetical protein
MLTQIYDYKEQRERASKALKLNDNDRFINPRPRLFAMSTTGTKPTIRIKRLDFSSSSGIKLKGPSAIIKSKRL